MCRGEAWRSMRAMIITVTIWRCKCGASVKVLTEAARNQAGTVIAACPNCGHQQLIDAQRLISVTLEVETTAVPESLKFILSE
jgi:hypothetical protein